MVIKRIEPLSAARVAATLYAMLGVFFGGILSLVALAGSAVADAPAARFGALMGVGAVVVLPILYGCFGFVFTLLSAWLYNVASGWVGGIQIDVQ